VRGWSRLLMLRASLFVDVRVRVLGAAARQRGSRESHQSAASEGSNVRRSTQALMRRGAVQQSGGAAEQAEQAICGGALRRSVVCCPVSGEPVRRRSMQVCRRVQRTAATGPGRQEDSDIWAACGLPVKRGGRVRGAKFRGAGGRSSVLSPALLVRLRCADRQRVE
jgi:hypothetical protein